MGVEACQPVDCKWGPWEYSSCSVTCGGGTKIGIRRVVQQSSSDGRQCTGPSLIEGDCNTQACPGPPGKQIIEILSLWLTLLFSVDCQWKMWSPWSSCTDSCAAADGTGNRIRSRKSIEHKNGGTACDLADRRGTQSCYEECPGEQIINILSL